MNVRSIILISFVLILWPQLNYAQNKKELVLPKSTTEAKAKTDPPPGSIQLLNGYIHTKQRGIDTAVGEISKPDGMKITYDIGFLASNYAWRINESGNNEAWAKMQKVNGMTLYLVGGKDKTIVATFAEPCANFMARTTNEEEVADFILMIMTYKPVISENKRIEMINGSPTC
jgi:hypothetical protein